MTSMKPRTLIAAAVLATLTGLAVSAPANARSATDIRREALEQHQIDQLSAINEGRRDGGITIFEKWRLTREQKRLARLQREAEADGQITKSEYLDLRDARRDAARHIDDERNNGRVRGWWWRTFVR